MQKSGKHHRNWPWLVLAAVLLAGAATGGYVSLSTTDVSSAAWVLDEDNMSSNSNTQVPTQQSVVAYTGATFQPDDDQLSAVAQVSAASDTLLYFTGSGPTDAAVTSLPAFGRTLIANTTAALARADLVAAGTGDANTFTAINTFDFLPTVPFTDLGVGTELAENVRYYVDYTGGGGVALTFADETPDDGAVYYVLVTTDTAFTLTLPNLSTGTIRQVATQGTDVTGTGLSVPAGVSSFAFVYQLDDDLFDLYDTLPLTVASITRDLDLTDEWTDDGYTVADLSDTGESLREHLRGINNALGSGFDATGVDAVTWSDGANASNVWTFDVSGTDPTVTFGNASVVVAGALSATNLSGTNTGDDDVPESGDFGAAGALEADGSLSANSVDSAAYVDGSIDVEHLSTAIRTEVRSFTILEPDEAQGVSDDIRLMKFIAEKYASGVTITSIHIDSSAAYTSETFLFEHWDDASGSTQATVESIACSAISTEDDGTLSDATIPADFYLMVNLDDTPEDVAYVTITVSFTY